MSHKLTGQSFYEIYPVSWKDGNGDGIGDIPGIISRLDYVKGMGFDGIWFNPFFDSPFRDGGYDIRDYRKIDSRFGTNKDAYRLIEECHKRGLKVLFDLVPGHMSWEAPLFLRSASPKKNSSSDLFIWTDNAWAWSDRYALVRGLFQRDGAYMVNFFVHQPALNYGFGSKDEKWMDLYDDEGPRKTRAFMTDVMRFWCSKGVDGFRCDMADSLVKNDTSDKAWTKKTWQEMFGAVREDYPGMIAVSEWSDTPNALEAGFDMDFVLDHEHNFSYPFFRYSKDGKKPLFAEFDQEIYDKAVSDLKWRIQESQKSDGEISVISGNHDTYRLASFLKGDALKLAYLFIFTLPGVPFVYAGDELMTPQEFGYPSKDGGFQRTGCRFLMKWDEDSQNHGWSETDAPLYLPVQTKGMSAEEAVRKKGSIYNLIKRLNEIRHERPADFDKGSFELIEGKAIAYRRGRLIVALNLKDQPLAIKTAKTPLLKVGKIGKTPEGYLLPKHTGLIVEVD